MPTSHEHVEALGTRLPGLRVGALARHRVGRVFRVGVVVVVLVAVVVLSAVQWFRPLPSARLHLTVASSIRLAGTAPALPWPVGAPAALAVEDGTMLGSSGAATPVPIAGLAKIMTAYVALQDHPLASGQDGPAITVGADAVSALQSETSSGQSVVPVTAGETLTELQVLQGLVVASGNDMAEVLAAWDAGSAQGFVAKMNSTAHALGMRATTFTDPVGLDPGTVSTPEDLIRLGDAVLKVPVLRQLMAMTEVTLPIAGRVFNLDAEIGHGGFIGIKTGSDAAAGGCFLFAAQRSVSGTVVTLVGAIVGEHTASPTASALKDAAALVSAAFADAGPQHVLAPGTTVGYVDASWTSHVPVVVPQPPVVIGWPGEQLSVHVTRWPIGTSMAAGTRVGTLSLVVSGQPVTVSLASGRALPGPGPWWRLTRL